MAEVFVGSDEVALCRVDGVVYAVSGVCPHAAGPLADGQLNGAVLTCPFHGWQFDVRDGSCLVDPEQPVARYAVEEREGQIAVGARMPAGRTDAPPS